jgi:hypothetical protein
MKIRKNKFPLEKCANGCDKKPCFPSLVLCEDCLEKITNTFKGIIKSFQDHEEVPPIIKERGSD